MVAVEKRNGTRNISKPSSASYDIGRMTRAKAERVIWRVFERAQTIIWIKIPKY